MRGSRPHGAEHQVQCQQKVELITCHPFVLSVNKDLDPLLFTCITGPTTCHKHARRSSLPGVKLVFVVLVITDGATRLRACLRAIRCAVKLFTFSSQCRRGGATTKKSVRELFTLHALIDVYDCLTCEKASKLGLRKTQIDR